MPLHRLFTPRAITPFLVGLVLLVVALAWDSGTGTISATTTGGPTVQGGESCPLPLGSQVKAVAAFAKMIPVFRHPRCSNCHGGVDPFVDPKTGKHGGGQQDTDAFEDGVCEDCHDQMSGGMKGAKWKMAPPPMFWVKKTDEELCMQVREMAPDAAKYVGHIRDDNGKEPFTLVAFKGMRGLSEGTKSVLSGNEITKESPPGTLELMTQQAQDYVDAMGGSLVGSSECGCKLQPVEVLFHSTLKIVNHGPANETSTITGEGRIVLELTAANGEPDFDMASELGLTSAPITLSGITVTNPHGCVIIITGRQKLQFDAWLGIAIKPELKVSVAIIPVGTELHGRMTRCPHPVLGWISASDSTPHIFSAAWVSLHGGPGALPMAGLTLPKPGAAPPGALDMSKIMSMDLKALEAMAEAMKTNPTPAAMADLAKLMNQVVPGADKMAADARNNFKFAIPDNKWCKLGTGSGFLAQCDINQTITVPDNKGSTQTITEKTTITIGRPAAKP